VCDSKEILITNMAAISARMSAMTQHLLPKLSMMNHNDDTKRVIDLSSGENPLIHDELQEIFQETVFENKNNVCYDNSALSALLLTEGRTFLCQQPSVVT
jgi:hypothetical protein